MYIQAILTMLYLPSEFNEEGRTIGNLLRNSMELELNEELSNMVATNLYSQKEPT